VFIAASISRGTSGFSVLRLAGTNTLACTIPAGKVDPGASSLRLINDYPCPDPSFEPAAGQTLEDFLTQGR
jgi:hypothetical protein